MLADKPAARTGNSSLRAVSRKAASTQVSSPGKLKSAAPGALLGFSLQQTRMVARLLAADTGDVVCLEVLDDVGVERPDGTQIAEQSKSSLRGNPLADRAVAFWKTIANWLDAVDSGFLSAETAHFELFVSRAVVAGSICRSFDDAHDPQSAIAAVAEARTKLWGQPPLYKARRRVAETLRPHLERVLSRSDAAIAAVIARMSVVVGRGNAYENLRLLTTKKLVSDDAVTAVVTWAVGWVKTVTDEMMQRGEPARVAYNDFHGALLTYVRKHDRDTTLRSVAGRPDSTAIERERALRTYVDQLAIVEASEDDVMSAITDFLRAASDRTFWAAKGHLDAGQLEAFANELQLSWRNFRQRLDITQRTLPPQERGRLLLLECNGHTARPGGLDCPPHFTRGSFHALSDEKTIGWHPDYVVEISRLLEARTRKQEKAEDDTAQP